jgi:hypothetical protein
VTSIEVARQEWAEGERRFESFRDDARRYGRLLELLELILDELRKRVGQTYTLRELAVAYPEAERWARELFEQRVEAPGWPRDLATALAAAFHAYQRGALDYEP